MKNKTGVQYVNVQYFKSSNGLCTICKLTCLIPYSKISQWIFDSVQERNTSEYFKKLGIVYTDGGFEFTTVGKVTLDPSDTNDETYARQIALTKCQAKAFRKANRFYMAIAENINNYLNNIQEYIDGSYNANISCMNHVDELINGGYEQ